MKRKRRILKRLIILLLVLVVVLVAIVFSFPYWSGFALKQVAGQFDVEFRKFERVENGRFVLSDVVRTNEAFDLELSRVEGYMPYQWYRQAKAVQGTNAAENFLKVDGWTVVVKKAPDDPNDDAQPSRSTYEIFKMAERYIELAKQWAPKALLLNGTVVYERKRYTFPLITWDEGRLEASGFWPISAVPIDIKGRFTDEGPYQLSYGMHPLDFRFRIRAQETNSLLHANVAVFYKDNQATANAFFPTNGVLPLTATLKAPSLNLPPELLKLDQYRELTGDLSGEWRSNRYTLNLVAHAEPYGSDLPPVDMDLALAGDTNSVRIERALSTAPGLQVSISDPLEMSYRGEMLSEESKVNLSIDLEKLPGLKLKGKLEGSILLQKDERIPKAVIQGSGSELAGYNVQVQSLEFGGELDWPMLENFRAEARVGTNAVARIAGSANLEQRILGETEVVVDGPIGTNAVPNLQFSRVELRGRFSGALTNLSHSVDLNVRQLQAPGLQPVNLEASWKAEQLVFDRLSLRAQAGPATIFVSGSGYAEPGRTNLVVNEARFEKGDARYLELSTPSRITLGTDPATSRPVIEVAPLSLSGSERHLALSGSLSWPVSGEFRLDVLNVDPSLFQPFVERSLRGLDLRTLNLAAGWSNGPVAGSFSGTAFVAQEPFGRLGAEVQLKLDADGLDLAGLSVRDASGEIAHAKGFLPVSIHPQGPDNIIALARREQIDFALQTTDNPAFWGTVEELTNVRLSNAVVRLGLRGTVQKPTGELFLKSDSVAHLSTNRELPEIGPLEAEIALNEQVLEIRDFSLRVEDQPATLTGAIALGTNFWKQRREEILDYAVDHANVRLQAPEIHVAAIAQYLPEYLSPEGEIRIDAALKPGRNLAGEILIRDVRTRPLPKTGVVTDIQADVQLDGRTVRLGNAQAVLGGERLGLRGMVDLSPESLAQAYPRLEFYITGNNLPLARNPDVILRSDLDLKVANGTNQVPVISGTANLRDSYLLSDIATLVPGRLAGPERRPPYFSVPQDPIDDWRLEISVRGENFMRVRSPFFLGLVSTSLRVGGTLEEPVALGQVSITSGSIIFPFATLQIRQGIVSLTPENPYLPNVFAVAGGRAFGFDIRMEAEGPADEPVIEFSSVPALTSEQIILMLTTGQIPREDFSYSATDRASRLAFFLGKSLWSKLNPGQPTEERLSVRSGQDITEQGRQTYEVEYKLSDRWSLVGEYDRWGELNANVKWKLFSR